MTTLKQKLGKAFSFDEIAEVRSEVSQAYVASDISEKEFLELTFIINQKYVDNKLIEHVKLAATAKRLDELKEEHKKFWNAGYLTSDDAQAFGVAVVSRRKELEEIKKRQHGERKAAKELLRKSLEVMDLASSDFDVWDIKEFISEIQSNLERFTTSRDFEFQIDNKSVRLIHEDSIDNIYSCELEEYLKAGWREQLDALPETFVIDWEDTVEQEMANSCRADHFSSYDGDEHHQGEYLIYRLN